MNEERPLEEFSLESLGGDPREQAASQLAVLETSLDSCREPAEVTALIDEAYRAAHALRAAVDPRTAPNVDRLARRMQDVVRAARAGSLSVTMELGSVLASIARVARGALENAGLAEALAISSAAATLEEIIEHPSAWSAPPGLSRRPFEWARVEAGRLTAAEEASRGARDAFSAYSRVAEETASLTGRFEEALDAHRRALDVLRDAVPRAMAAAARGEATSASAAEVAQAMSDIGSLAAGLEAPLTRNAGAVREAAAAGRRAADICEGAFASLASVRLDALLHHLPGVVRAAARRSGASVELLQEPTNVEVVAARSDVVIGLVTRCVKAVIGAMSPVNSRRHRHGSEAPARLSVFARAAGESLHLRLAFSGPVPDSAALNECLEAVRRRIQREGAGLDAESRKGESASVLLTVRSAASVSSRTAEFVFARSGESWYAIPAAAVVECVEGGLSMGEYLLEGVALPMLRMNETVDPHRAVVVKTPRGGAVLLFDGIGSRETGLQSASSANAPGIAGIAGTVRRLDGSSASLLDLTVLLPQPG